MSEPVIFWAKPPQLQPNCPLQALTLIARLGVSPNLYRRLIKAVL
jgi:hypothetical protein